LVCGRDVSVDEVIDVVLRDKIFYKNNGGVTFSGGECLMQSDFVAAALKELKQMGLHTAVDTSGYVPWASIEKTLDVCDLYLYDVKCIDPGYHKEYTGVDNAPIIDNLKRLSSTGKNIWIRVPVIPDFNDRCDEMESIASFVATLEGDKQTTLMPYHTLGAGKYRTLGLEYTYKSSAKLEKDRLEEFKKIFEKQNILLK
jgi:pyruvate formate lyase activating enzyme